MVAVLIEYLGEKIISGISNITVKVRHDNMSVKDWYQQYYFLLMLHKQIIILMP